MEGVGTTAILIVLAIAALVAAPGLLASRGGTLGRIFRDFRKTPATDSIAANTTTTTAAPQSKSSRFCTECGSPLAATAAFCTQCGASI